MTLVVGVTGNIASGKSTVAARFGERGATVIDADVLARDALAPGTSAFAAVATRWPSVITSDGVLDRGALRRIVFNSRHDRDALNAIVHPEVGRLRDQQLAAAAARGDRIVVYDVPLLFEAGLETTVDVIVLVEASEATRHKRLRKRGLAAGDANAMIAAQMPTEQKRARADFVIENDGDTAALIARTDAVWDALARGQRDG
jgi:dephospho-CoA kinase